MHCPIIVYHTSIWVSRWLCRQGGCWPVITVIWDQWSNTYYGVWGLVVFALQIRGCARWVFGQGESPDILLSQFAADGCYLVWRGHVSFFKVKVTWTDLVSFAFIRHFLAIIGFRVSVIAICARLFLDFRAQLGRQCHQQKLQ